MQPILSIIIPTRNRGIYCIEAIKSILSIPDLDFELVVQDNSDNSLLKDLVEKNISDNRLLYFYSPQPLSSIDNFNIALEKAKGQFLCLIGDDDGVLPEILKITRWANSKGIDSVCTTSIVGYAWPGVYPAFKKGVIFIPKYSEKVLYQKPLEKLPALLHDGITDYSRFNLPRLYHGLIERSCMEEIKKQTGNYFGGLSPDIYSTIALSGIVKNHVILDIPFTIPGVCKSSTSSDSSKQKHCGNLEDAPHLRSRADYIWEPEIPRYYSVQTIWAESGIKSLKENNIQYSSKSFNMAKMVAFSLISSYSVYSIIIKQTNKLLKKQRKSYFIFYTKVLLHICLRMFKLFPVKIKNAFLKILPSSGIISNVANISIASNKVSEIFKPEKYLFLYKL